MYLYFRSKGFQELASVFICTNALFKEIMANFIKLVNFLKELQRRHVFKKYDRELFKEKMFFFKLSVLSLILKKNNYFGNSKYKFMFKKNRERFKNNNQ